MYSPSYTQGRQVGALGGYAGQTQTRRAAYAAESHIAARAPGQGHLDRTAVTPPSVAWRTTSLQGSPDAGGTQGPYSRGLAPSLRSSHEYLSSTREDDRLHNREIYDVALHGARLKGSPNAPASSSARPPPADTAFGRGGNFPTRVRSFGQATSSYARPSSPQRIAAHYESSTYGSTMRSGERAVSVRSIFNSPDGLAAGKTGYAMKNRTESKQTEESMHWRQAADDPAKSEGPSTPRVLVVTPRGTPRTRSLETSDRTAGPNPSLKISMSDSASSSFMARQDPLTGGSVSNRTKTVLEALELLTLSSSQCRRDVRGYNDKKDSTSEDSEFRIKGRQLGDQGPSSSSTTQANVVVGGEGRREGAGARRRISLPPSPTTSVGKGSGPDEDSNPHLNATEEVLAEGPFVTSSQYQGDSDVPLNPVASQSRPTAPGSSRHVPPLRLPIRPTFDSAQGAEKNIERPPELHFVSTAGPRTAAKTGLEPQSIPTESSSNSGENCTGSILQSSQLESDDAMANHGNSQVQSISEKRGQLRVSDAAQLRKLDTGARSPMTSHALNSMLDELDFSNAEGDQCSGRPDDDMARDDDTNEAKSQKAQSEAFAEACAECEVHKYKYRSLRQEFSDREAQLQEQISLLTKNLQQDTENENEARTRIENLNAELERSKAETDAASTSWQESVKRLEATSLELEASKSDLVLAKLQLADAAKALEKSACDLEEAQTQLKRRTTESDLKSGIAWKKDMDLETKSNELLAAQQKISALEARLESKRIRQLETDLETTKSELEIARRCSIRESLGINALPSTINRSGSFELPATPPSGTGDEGKSPSRQVTRSGSSELPPTPPSGTGDEGKSPSSRVIRSRSFDLLPTPPLGTGDEGKSPSRDWSAPSTSVYNLSILGDASHRPSNTSNSISQRSPTPTRGTALRAPTPPLVEADTTTSGSPAQYFLALHGRSSPMKMKSKSPATAYSSIPPPALIESTDRGKDSPATKRSASPDKPAVPALDLVQVSSSGAASRSASSPNDTVDADRGEESSVAKTIRMFDKKEEAVAVAARKKGDQGPDVPPGVPFRLVPSPARFEPASSSLHEISDEDMLGPTPRTHHTTPRTPVRQDNWQSYISDLIYNQGRSSVTERARSATIHGSLEGRTASLQHPDPRDSCGADGYAGLHLGNAASPGSQRDLRMTSASTGRLPHSPSSQHSSIHSRHARGSVQGGGQNAKSSGRAASLSSDIYVSDRSFLC